MNKTGSKKVWVILACAVLLALAIVLAVSIGRSAADASAAQSAAVSAAGSGSSAASAAAAQSGTGERGKAEALIGKTVSREDVQKAVGEWKKFEMSANGCERGVYAGRFYYQDFTIFSRTYDKGETFRIVSVN